MASGVLLSAVGFLPRRTNPPRESSPLPRSSTAIGSFQELLKATPAEIETLDIGLVNALCAQGLPGAENLDIQDCLRTLDGWATRVKAETERHFYRFRAHPEQFENSEGYFRMLMMAVVLYEDFGVRYNPARISSPANLDPNDKFFADSKDIFIHGLCGDRRMGTCSSMPVLFIAIGRRLDYPLKLVTTKAHLFARWESPTERFNVEATGKGMNRYDDEHFKHWPFEVTEQEIKIDGYLRSLTPVEELGVFLSLRGHCLKEAGRLTEAKLCYAEAARLVPNLRAYHALVADFASKSFSSGQRHPLASGPLPRSSVPDPNPLRNIQSRTFGR